MTALYGYQNKPFISSINPLAFAYIRFSSKRQELGNSVSRQMEAATKWCQYNNIELSEVTFEELGISAFKEGGKRPGLADMIDCIKKGIIPTGSYVLLENSDRLSRRGFKVALDLVHEMVSLGVYIVTLSNGQIFSKDNITELSAMLPLLLDADRGRAESVRKSNLIKSAKKGIRESRAKKGKLPFWLTNNDGNLELNEHTVKVEKMIELRLQNWSAQRIAKYLNEHNMLTARETTWAAISISATLKNRLLYGCKEYTEVIDGKMVPIEQVDNWAPAICTKKVWQSFQQKKRAGTGSLTRQSYFSGILRCPKCMGAMQQRKQYHKDKVYAYRRCLNSIEGRCDVRGNFKEVDLVVKEALIHLKVVEFNDSEANNDVETLRALEAKLDSLNMSKQYITSPVAIGKMYEDIAITEQEIAELKAKMEVEQSSNKAIRYRPIFDMPVLEGNAELKRIIAFIKMWKLNDKQDKYKVQYHNGHHHTFVVSHTRGGNTTNSKWKIKFSSDTVKFKNWLNDFVQDDKNNSLEEEYM